MRFKSDSQRRAVMAKLSQYGASNWRLAYKDKNNIARYTIRKTTKGHIVSKNGRKISIQPTRYDAERIANQRRKWDNRHRKVRQYELVTTRTGFDMPFIVHGKNKEDVMKEIKPRLRKGEKVISLERHDLLMS